MADFYYFMAAYLPISRQVFHVHSILSCNFILFSYRKGAFQRLFVIPGRLERPTNRTGICHSIH